jgi:hypothetical protein
MWTNIQAGTILIISCNEKGDTKGTRHDTLFTLGTFSESQSQIANGLGTTLHPKRLVEVEGMVLTLDTRMFDHATRISLKTTHGTSDMTIDLDNLLNRRRLEEGGSNALFDTKDDTFASRDLWIPSFVSR